MRTVAETRTTLTVARRTCDRCGQQLARITKPCPCRARTRRRSAADRMWK